MKNNLRNFNFFPICNMQAKFVLTRLGFKAGTYSYKMIAASFNHARLSAIQQDLYSTFPRYCKLNAVPAILTLYIAEHCFCAGFPHPS